MDQFHIRPLTETDITEIVAAGGGVRAHPDADRRAERGGDFIVDGAVIELKLLDEDGLEKTQRQERVASLFLAEGCDAPVVVLDRETLSESGKLAYDRAIEGPIRGAIASARKQLKQTRSERPDTRLSVLWVINNGYTALNHDDLVRLVAHRVRNDTTSVDGLIVGGCYFHSDGFDHFFLWPLEYVPVRLDSFPGFDALHEAWGKFAERFMTAAIRGELSPDLLKGPVVDSQFDVDGVTFVKPAPPIRAKSDFYRTGRPRNNSTGLAHCPPVALTFPGLTRAEWGSFRGALPDEPGLGDSYDGWLQEQRKANEVADALQPLVTISIDYEGWQSWCAKFEQPKSMTSIRAYANVIFQDRVQAVITGARELKINGFAPSRYILVVTDEIGQDRANDLSHIAVVRQRGRGEPDIRSIVEDLRIFHEHAIALGSAYAVAEGLDAVMWIRHSHYAWA